MLMGNGEGNFYIKCVVLNYFKEEFGIKILLYFSQEKL